MSRYYFNSSAFEHELHEHWKATKHLRACRRLEEAPPAKTKPELAPVVPIAEPKEKRPLAA